MAFFLEKEHFRSKLTAIELGCLDEKSEYYE